jgi:hypothetical protein
MDAAIKIGSDRFSNEIEFPPVRSNGGGGGPINCHGLTAKEEIFSRSVAAGESQSEAYRQAYTAANMKPQTIWHEAHLTAKRPWVRKRIDGLREALDADALNDAVQIRSFIAERLWQEAKDVSNRASERLKAIELLGKLYWVGAFVERTKIERNLRPDEIRFRIRKILQNCELAGTT